MRLTERDIQILLKVHECCWLCTSQIKRYFFAEATNRAVNKRLHLLVRGGYLFCQRLSPTEEYYFRVGVKGKVTLVEWADLLAENIYIPRRLPVQLHHFSTLNDLRWYFEESIHRQGGNLDFFLVDRELKGMLVNVPVIPDVLVGFNLRRSGIKKQYLLALEYDSGSENPQFFGRDKVKEYYKAMEYEFNIFNCPEFQIIVFADTRKRVVQLIRYSMGFLDSRIRFLFGSVDDLEKCGNLFKVIFIDPQKSLDTNSEIMCSLIS